MTRYVCVAAALAGACAAPQKPQVADASDRSELDRSMDAHSTGRAARDFAPEHAERDGE